MDVAQSFPKLMQGIHSYCSFMKPSSSHLHNRMEKGSGKTKGEKRASIKPALSSPLELKGFLLLADLLEIAHRTAEWELVIQLNITLVL